MEEVGRSHLLVGRRCQERGCMLRAPLAIGTPRNKRGLAFTEIWGSAFTVSAWGVGHCAFGFRLGLGGWGLRVGDWGLGVGVGGSGLGCGLG